MICCFLYLVDAVIQNWGLKWSLIIRHDITIGMNFVKIVDKYMLYVHVWVCQLLKRRYQLWRDKKSSLVWDVSHLSKSELCCGNFMPYDPPIYQPPKEVYFLNNVARSHRELITKRQLAIIYRTELAIFHTPCMR